MIVFDLLGDYNKCYQIQSSEYEVAQSASDLSCAIHFE